MPFKDRCARRASNRDRLHARNTHSARSLFEWKPFPCLPTADPLAAENKAPAGPAPFRGCGTLLVVDDETDARAVARAMGTYLGFQVVEASDGEEAVAIFQQRKGEFALVLMDLTRPRMDGREAFLRMRELDPTVPVVLTSGFSEGDAVVEFAGRGLAGFLPKPYQRSTFEAVMKKAVEVKRG